jgi:CTP-dependent riboflavin kinase
MNEVYQMVGWWPYPGTLNVRVSNLRGMVDSLGPPLAETEHETKIGPLRWWTGKLELPDESRVVALLVRGKYSKTNYLEFVTQVPLRWAMALKNGDQVWFIPNGHSS